ncbi:hypothetical protein HYW21_00740 [Candidatus Woesearchaeota archaeon]|nr:hypothetical protein [Candidatus Woesearchaeota archaeon]
MLDTLVDTPLLSTVILPLDQRLSHELLENAVRSSSAVLVESQGLLPLGDTGTSEPVEGIPLRLFEEADRTHVPLLFLREGHEAGYRRKMDMLKARGAVELGALPSQAFTVRYGLQRIVDQASAMHGLRTPQAAHAIREDAARVFARPDFSRQNAYQRFMMSSILQELADELTTTEGPLVIDCGHIDSPKFTPTNADRMIFLEGIALFYYLKDRGHDVRLGILVNETYAINKLGLPEARKVFDTLQEQRKQTGSHHIIDETYRVFLDQAGINPQDDVLCSFEGHYMHNGRQRLARHRNGKSTFMTDLVEEPEGIFSLEGTGDDALKRPLYYASGAPNCHLVSGIHNEWYARKGIQTVVYLRDITQSNRRGDPVECGIRGGAQTAVRTLGVTITAYFVPYVPDPIRQVTALPTQKLT